MAAHKEEDMLSKETRRHTILLKSVLLCVFLIPIIVPFPGRAQNAITSDGTMGTTVNFDSGNYDISNGTIKGSNQFHSFDVFSVPTGESATFNGPPIIENIISRVTGGELSSIDGLLSSTIEGANLYLLNPAGILFGPNARLDLKGSFHASTADYLKFSDSFVFNADQTPYATLTVASPEAFGFLNGTPPGIALQASGDEVGLEVTAGETLSLVGGDIEIVGGSDDFPSILAPGGQVNLASVATPGEVIPNLPGEAPDLSMASFAQLGEIALSEAHIEAGGDGGGTVIIRGGRLFLTNGSDISASVKSPAGGGTLGVGIDIEVAHDVQVDNSEMWTSVFQGVADDSGGIRIRADHLEVANFSQLNSLGFSAWDVFPPSEGNTGDIELTTNSLLLRDGSSVRTGTGGLGDAGDIVINTVSLEVRDASYIMSNTWDGTGNAGDVIVGSEEAPADSILLSNQKYPGYLTAITSRTGVFDYQTFVGKGTGSGGDITVNANSLQMFGGTEISTPSFFSGQGGDITLNIAGDVSIQGSESLQPWQTGIFANTFVFGQGGSLSLTADSLDMTSKTAIQTTTFGFGNAGNTVLDVGRLEVKDRSFIVTSGLFGAGGSAGNMEINADTIHISGPATSADPFGADFTGLSTQAGPWGGQGGEVTITATDSMTLTSRANITASSDGPGAAGNMMIETDTLQVLDGSAITAGAFGTGPGGNIVVEADNVLVSGVHPEPYVDATGVTNLAPSAIGSQSGVNGGSAGNVTITATNSIQLLDGGRLGADTFGDGDGGNITARADNVLISGVNADILEMAINLGRDTEAARSQIGSFSDSSRTSVDATGNPGNIRVEASNLQLEDGGMITSETETRGLGGNIELIAERLTLSNDALVTARSINAGNSGSIAIGNVDNRNDLPNMQELLINNSTVTTSAQQASGGDIDMSASMVQLLYSSVRAESFGDGDAGNIYIRAPALYYMNHASVTTEAVLADGGDIKIDADGMVHIVDSEISASVGGGPDTEGGNVSIDPEYVILVNSNVIAQAFEGRGGAILIIADLFLQDEYSEVSASSAKGIHGTVDIRAPIKDISQQVKPLQKRFTSASEMLRESCIARIRGGEYSSFVVGGRDGLPLEPGPRGLLPSPLPLQ
jgi:filamentous hemagglutinin family protein